MTVNTERCYSELIWTGGQTSFAAGFVANDALHVAARYRNAAGVVSDLVRDTQIKILRDPITGAISAVPLAMPAAPGRVILSRHTPAQQDTDFANLKSFNPSIHTRLHDAAAMRSAEARRDHPVTVDLPEGETGRIDYGSALNVAGAAPRGPRDFITMAWAAANLGIDNLQALFDGAAATLSGMIASAQSGFNATLAACQALISDATASFGAQITGLQDQFQTYMDGASAALATAAASATAAQVQATAATASAATAQAWAESPTDVIAGHPSAKSWAGTAQAFATAAANWGQALANTDYGDFSADDGTGPSDYGDFS
ncbi:hypothetical protein IP86_02950 [Rhodopseudomonas sp. AAP120]|uniref:hypothetical protein n=1 Tax=Rhodopseudomonas sp. AAP120 TaxID=1523430 RepID=UPI0006B88083|nr:hypothetical protein [Rhodopseudomonas sp. AAP120]KPG01782.1 hypothetical protein IP86_02950 [Rhodopseudomonas sp. AAP120]